MEGAATSARSACALLLACLLTPTSPPISWKLSETQAMHARLDAEDGAYGAKNQRLGEVAFDRDKNCWVQKAVEYRPRAGLLTKFSALVDDLAQLQQARSRALCAHPPRRPRRELPPRVSTSRRARVEAGRARLPRRGLHAVRRGAARPRRARQGRQGARRQAGDGRQGARAQDLRVQQEHRPDHVRRKRLSNTSSAQNHVRAPRQRQVHHVRRRRHKRISEFQNSSAPGCRIFIVTVATAAVGITLTAATRVYLMEPMPDVATAGGKDAVRPA